MTTPPNNNTNFNSFSFQQPAFSNNANILSREALKAIIANLQPKQHHKPPSSSFSHTSSSSRSSFLHHPQYGQHTHQFNFLLFFFFSKLLLHTKHELIHVLQLLFFFTSKKQDGIYPQPSPPLYIYIYIKEEEIVGP
jgi:hypothetical protein